MRVKIFADGASIKDIKRLEPQVAGFTTNPTLMRKAGVTDYEQFARGILSYTHKPVSFEVIADDFYNMEIQARRLAAWGDNVYVKIPISTTSGESTFNLVHELAHKGIKINVTAITTMAQIIDISKALNKDVPAYISVFSGRIADTGIDPIASIQLAVSLTRGTCTEVIWASPRELLNVVQADECGCDIITMTPDLLTKLPLIGKGLLLHSLDTVKMFYEDAVASGLTL